MKQREANVAAARAPRAVHHVRSEFVNCRQALAAQAVANAGGETGDAAADFLSLDVGL